MSCLGIFFREVGYRFGIFCIDSGLLVDGDDADDDEDGAVMKLWRVSQSLVWASGM